MRMTALFRCAGLSGVIFLSSFAYAQASSPKTFPEVTLSAHASQEVANDEMVVILGAGHTGPSIGELNQKVLSELNLAIREAKKHPSISVKNEGVHTSQAWNSSGRPSGWRVTGRLVLSSQDMKTLGELAGSLSQKLQLHGVHFRLSEKESEKTRDALLNEAAREFQGKAQTIALAFGYSGFEVLSVGVDMPHAPEVMPQRRMMAAMDMASSVAAEGVSSDGGNTSVRVTLNGTVLLKNP